MGFYDSVYLLFKFIDFALILLTTYPCFYLSLVTVEYLAMLNHPFPSS